MLATRYNRQVILPEVGEEGQLKLQKSKVLIIGAGGLASAILPYLVAAGVGEIGIVDDFPRFGQLVTTDRNQGTA